jgi:hypothetical protein
MKVIFLSILLLVIFLFLPRDIGGFVAYFVTGWQIPNISKLIINKFNEGENI